MHDHWFDTLSKALVRELPRRTLVGAAAAAITSLGLIAQPESGLAKKRKKHKRKGKKKNRNKNRRSKVTPLLCDPYLLDACNVGPSYVSGDPAACEDMCERCQQEGSAFCLVPTGDDDFPRQPTCCHYADECCGDANFGFGECCTADRCCDGVGGKPPHCAEPGTLCCRNGDGGACPIGSECCGGNCVACDPPDVMNPATCECELSCGDRCVGPGLACCPRTGSDYACVDIYERINNFHCGGCDRPCTGPFERCCDGTCFDIRFNNARCGGDCEPCPAGLECCHGQCIDPQYLVCCPDAPSLYSSAIWCSVSMTCCTNADGEPDCC